MKPSRIVLHIARLQLHGVLPEQRDALVAGLRAGLEQALAAEGVAQRWAGSGHRERVRGSVTGSADAATFGQAAARGIVDRSAQ